MSSSQDLAASIGRRRSESATARPVDEPRNFALCCRGNNKTCRPCGSATTMWGTGAMRINSRQFARAFALAVTLAAAAAHAEEYPSHPIHLIVPYAAGGGADSVARVIAKRVSETHRTTHRDREPRRRRLDHRHRARAQSRSGRLHAAARPIRADFDQPRRLQKPALRPDKGFCPDHDDDRLPLHHGGQSCARRQNRCRNSSRSPSASRAN